MTNQKDHIKKLEKDLREMFQFEAQRNELNFALSGVERGEMTIKDYEDDLSVAISNWIVKDLFAQHDAEMLKQLKKSAKHYTADSLEADGLDTWAVPLSVLEQYQPQKGAK